MTQPSEGNVRHPWVVTTQVQGTGQNESGHFVSGFTVGFRTAGGLTGTVFVPAALYTPEAVAQAVSAAVANMTAIQQLHG